MKYPKSLIGLYLICIIKLVNTGLFFVMPDDMHFLRIVSVVFCLAGTYHSEIAFFCVLILMTSVVLWVCSIIFAVLGTKFYNARRKSVILLTVVTFLDFGASFISDSFFFKISCSTMSAIILVICILCLNHLKKKSV